MLCSLDCWHRWWLLWKGSAEQAKSTARVFSPPIVAPPFPTKYTTLVHALIPPFGHVVYILVYCTWLTLSRAQRPRDASLGARSSPGNCCLGYVELFSKLEHRVTNACSLLRLEFNSRLLDYYTELDAVRLVGRRPPSCPSPSSSSPAHTSMLAPTPTPECLVGAAPAPAHALCAQTSVGPDASDQQLVTSTIDKANPLASLASLARRLAAQLSLADGDAADSLASSNGLFDLLNVCYVL